MLNSVGNSEVNRDKYYTSDEANYYDWCSPQLSDWSMEYDPCPNGWRLPTINEMDDLIENSSTWTTNDGQNGYWFSADKAYLESGDSNVFLPAAGYTDLDGSTINRGRYGDYWTSSFEGTSAQYLAFSFLDFVGLENYYRVYGFSVRCVKI